MILNTPSITYSQGDPSNVFQRYLSSVRTRKRGSHIKKNTARAKPKITPMTEITLIRSVLNFSANHFSTRPGSSSDEA